MKLALNHVPIKLYARLDLTSGVGKMLKSPHSVGDCSEYRDSLLDSIYGPQELDQAGSNLNFDHPDVSRRLYLKIERRVLPMSRRIET